MHGNEPAFPSEKEFTEGGKDFLDMPVIVHRNSYGLSKREYFAAKAMQGYLAGSVDAIGHGMIDYKNIVAWSVDLADALIKQLNETKETKF